MTDRVPTADDRRRAVTHVLVDDPALLDGDTIPLDGPIEHHLRRVLRLRDGDVVSATDGRGRWRLARVTSSVQQGLLVAVSPAVGEARDHLVTVATAMPKGERLDWLVQKCTELGADRIVLLHAERSVVRWKPERAGRQLSRLQRVADEATRQSRRVWRTEVAGPRAAVDVLAGAWVAEPGAPMLSGPGAGLDVTIAIGPEGGWSDDELALAGRRVGLSPHVLRTETAAVAAVARCVVERH